MSIANSSGRFLQKSCLVWYCFLVVTLCYVVFLKSDIQVERKSWEITIYLRTGGFSLPSDLLVAWFRGIYV